MTRLLNRLPGFRRSPAGLEWRLLRQAPRIAVVGTLAPILVANVVWLAADAPDAKLATSLAIAVAGVLALHWTVVFTGALACVIVMVAKGPAYVADAYELPDFDG